MSNLGMLEKPCLSFALKKGKHTLYKLQGFALSTGCCIIIFACVYASQATGLSFSKLIC